MIQDLSNYRKPYQRGVLLEERTPDNPMELFNNWFSQTRELYSLDELNTMCLSTIGTDGFPKNRIVLLKKITQQGFTFYTNYNSEKGKSIEKNPNVCLSFFWHILERQVIIKGIATKIDEKSSDNYFKSRPRGSKLGACASEQSQIIPSREFLETILEKLKKKYKGKEIPRPKNWGGYIVEPRIIEFWQGRPNRMHDRICYTLQKKNKWVKQRMAP